MIAKKIQFFFRFTFFLSIPLSTLAEGHPFPMYTFFHFYSEEFSYFSLDVNNLSFKKSIVERNQQMDAERKKQMEEVYVHIIVLNI